MEWYYILGIIVYSIFLIQFFLSLIGGIDFDLDVNFDGEVDFLFSDLISFKGLIHFLMGLSGWLMVTGSDSPLNIAIAFFIGVAFMIGLYYIYKSTIKLQSTPTSKHGLELVGTVATVYLTMSSISDKHCICIICNGGITQEINCITSTPVKVGDKRTIIDYQNGIYHIS